MDNYSLNDRIDKLTIAYITSVYDMPDMSVEEFMDTYSEVSSEIFKYISDHNS